MKKYLVGGAVRDLLLGLQSKDRDWVVIGETPQSMTQAGFKQVGADFPVFLEPVTGEEYALARTERKSGIGYKGFECSFGADVTLEEDLCRRDLTINAMAMSESGDIIDPFNGQKDLDKKILRHVSSAFAEDTLRVLRVARFMARYEHLGFSVATETISLMKSLNSELSSITPERIWKEMSRALLEPTPSAFFETLRKSDSLAVILPEVDCLFGIPQPEMHHPEIDTGIHTMLVINKASELSKDVDVIFAALTHDLGKGITKKSDWPRHFGHEKNGVEIVHSVCDRLKVPTECKKLAMLSSEFHVHAHNAFVLQPKTIMNLFNSFDAIRNEEKFKKFLLVAQSDSQGRKGMSSSPYPQRKYLEDALVVVKNASIKQLVEKGLTGAELGARIREKRIKELSCFKKEEREQALD